MLKHLLPGSVNADIFRIKTRRPYDASGLAASYSQPNRRIVGQNPDVFIYSRPSYFNLGLRLLFLLVCTVSVEMCLFDFDILNRDVLRMRSWPLNCRKVAFYWSLSSGRTYAIFVSFYQLSNICKETAA